MTVRHAFAQRENGAAASQLPSKMRGSVGNSKSQAARASALTYVDRIDPS